LVDETGSPVGLVTLSRVRHVPDEARATTLVDEVAVPMDGVVTVGPDDEVDEVVERFAPGTGRRALVVDPDGTLAGIVTASDVERALERAGVAPARRPRPAARPLPPVPPLPPGPRCAGRVPRASATARLAAGARGSPGHAVLPPLRRHGDLTCGWPSPARPATSGPRWSRRSTPIPASRRWSASPGGAPGP